MYFLIKIIHVISAAVLMGASVGTAFYLFYANRQKDIALIANATKQAVFVNGVFTGTSGIVQFFSGIALIVVKGYSFSAFWVVGSMMGYVIAVVCWGLVSWLQIRCRDFAFTAIKNNNALSKKYYRCYHVSGILFILMFLSLMAVFYLMVNKPI